MNAPETDWIFVRHGQTEWNRGGRIQGQRDIHLNDHGREQARRNGRKLAGLGLGASVPFLVSPMARSQETARIVRREMGLDPDAFETVSDLRELSFGLWEGRTLVDVWQDDPDPVEARKLDKWSYVTPEGESYADLHARVVPILRALPGQAVIVSHGGTMRTAIHELTALDPMEAAILEIPQDRCWRWNGTAGEWV